MAKKEEDKAGPPAEWKGLENLQPKQGEVERITRIAESGGLKEQIIQKESVRKVLTIRDGAPHWVHFDDKGKEIRSEKVVGH